ncbi:hypothetical protein DMENIID0001_141440 [Sergentomyia squamirostris]
MRLFCVIFLLLLLARKNSSLPAEEKIRIRRQDQSPAMSKMEPWMELGMKYGSLTATEIMVPMAKEAMELAGQQAGEEAASRSK